jgi:hypothetical protein
MNVAYVMDQVLILLVMMVHLHVINRIVRSQKTILLHGMQMVMAF